MSNVIFDDRPHTDYGLVGIYWAEEVMVSSLQGCVSGQENGLLAAGTPGRLTWPMASQLGGGRMRIVVHETPPPVDDACPVVVEASIIVPPESEAAVCTFDNALDIDDFPVGTLRVRLSILHADEASQEDPLPEDRTPVDEYHVDIWPQEWSSDRVIRMESDWARYWHEANLQGDPPESTRLAEALAPSVEGPTDALVMRHHGLWSGRDVVIWARHHAADARADRLVTRLVALSDSEFHLVDQILAEVASPAFERSRGRSHDDHRLSGRDQRLVILAARACLQHDVDPLQVLPLLADAVPLDQYPLDPPSRAAELGTLLEHAAEGQDVRKDLLTVCRHILTEWDAQDSPALAAYDELNGAQPDADLPPWDVMEEFCRLAAAAGEVLDLCPSTHSLAPVWRAAGARAAFLPGCHHASGIHSTEAFTLDRPDQSVAALHCCMTLDPLDDAGLADAFRELRRVLRPGGLALVGIATPASDRDFFPNFDRRESRAHALVLQTGLGILAAVGDWEDGEPGAHWMLVTEPRAPGRRRQ